MTFIQVTDVKNHEPKPPTEHTLSDGRQMMLHDVSPEDFLGLVGEVAEEDGTPNRGAMAVALIRLSAHDHEGHRLFGCNSQVVGTIGNMADIATTAAKVTEICGLTTAKKNLTDGDSSPSG